MRSLGTHPCFLISLQIILMSPNSQGATQYMMADSHSHLKLISIVRLGLLPKEEFLNRLRDIIKKQRSKEFRNNWTGSKSTLTILSLTFKLSFLAVSSHLNFKLVIRKLKKIEKRALICHRGSAAASIIKRPQSGGKVKAMMAL